MTHSPGLAAEPALCSQLHCSGLDSLGLQPAPGAPTTLRPVRGHAASERRCSSFSAPFDRIAEINFHIDADEDSVSLHSVFVGGGRTRRWVGSGGQGLLPVWLRARYRELCEYVVPTAQRGSV